MVTFLTFKQFGRSKIHRTGRSLKYGKTVTVGKAKVDNLDILTIMGDHYIGWLQIPMYNLAGVDVLNGTAYLTEKFNCQFLGNMVSDYQIGQAVSINPFHLNAVSQFR